MLAMGTSFLVVLVRPAAASFSPEQIVPMHARGTFEVQITPLPADAYADAATMGRMLLDKQFSGDLTGTGKGQMITGMGSVKGSAAYSAIERVTGTVNGRTGTFMLQHTGIMHDGAQELSITIVPASGTGELTGIAGTFALTIEGKVHRYDLSYTLPAAP
jgi:hypothetical protein